MSSPTKKSGKGKTMKTVTRSVVTKGWGGKNEHQSKEDF